ncbi:MAG: hypothetical protein Q8S00_25325 [Deltaproteobacteria bacterium]|nr:hypothetical protein [Deltaproteobacteria bacterium]MDZ4344468.1 hypothetical protein [Candidatus Binatia bacterium]
MLKLYTPFFCVVSFRCTFQAGDAVMRIMHQADEFKQQLRDSLQRETQNSRAFQIARQANVYTAGDQAEAVYFERADQTAHALA